MIDPISLIVGMTQMVQGWREKAAADKMLAMTRAASKRHRNEQAVYAKGALADPLLPGGSAMLDRADVAAANALSSAGQYGNPMAALGAIMGQQTKAYQDVGIASAQDQKQDYLRMLSVLAGNADKEYDEGMGAYIDKYREGRQMVGGGLINAYNGIGGASAFQNAGVFYQKTPKPVNSGNMSNYIGAGDWNYDPRNRGLA